jgi:translation machinery-associated protein 16
LKQRITAEEREYVSGFWIPDMMNTENLKKLHLWSGEWTSLNTLAYVRIKKDGEVNPSSFPPKGQS